MPASLRPTVALIVAMVALASCGGGGSTEQASQSTAAAASSATALEGVRFDVRRDPG